MARFKMEIPAEQIREMELLTNNCETMISEMCMAGAEIVKSKIYQGMPAELKKYANAQTLNVTKSYVMQSTGARAVYIWLGGYKKDKNGKDNSKADDRGTALELIANMFEYGSKKRKYPKQPFLRKAFHKRDIERAMLKAQKRWIKEEADFK